MQPLARLKMSLFPNGVGRELNALRNRLFKRCTEADLVAAFQRLQIPSGAYLCVHSMLSGMGYLVGGPETVIRAIQRAVPGCTIMMPSFPFTGTAKDYLDQGGVFDSRSTPSKSGMLTDCFWKMPGALRSRHPTHACAALGPGAHDLIDGSEQSLTPFGDDSTYGRFAKKPNAHLLLIHTNNTSIVHLMQEMVEMPNLFLPTVFEARTWLTTAEVVPLPVKVHTPTLPVYVIEGDGGGGREFLILPDYLLLFPKYNYQRIRERLRGNHVWEKLRRRHESFVERGIYTISGCGDSEIMSVKVAPWLKEGNDYIRSSLKQYHLDYTAENLAAMNDAGRLTR